MSPAATCLSSDRVSPLPDNILEDPPQRRLNSHCLCGGFAAIRSPTADKCNAGVYCIHTHTHTHDIILYCIMHVCLLYNIPCGVPACIWSTETSALLFRIFFPSNFSFSSESGFPYGIGLQYITIIVNEYPPLHALHIIMVTRTDKWAWSSILLIYYYYHTFFFSIYYNARERTSTHSRIRYWLIIRAYAYAK
jgi:hypothetical protein